jgi:polyhydroxyalkanoate synthesis regulator phasin
MFLWNKEKVLQECQQELGRMSDREKDARTLAAYAFTAIREGEFDHSVFSLYEQISFAIEHAQNMEKKLKPVIGMVDRTKLNKDSASDVIIQMVKKAKNAIYRLGYVEKENESSMTTVTDDICKLNEITKAEHDFYRDVAIRIFQENGNSQKTEAWRILMKAKEHIVTMVSILLEAQKKPEAQAE